MLNRVTLQGRLVFDPELKKTPGGKSVVSTRIAVDRDVKSESGEKKTDWIDIVAWNGTAEYLSRYGSKGRHITVDGRLQTRDWTDKDGNKRTAVDVLASSIYFNDNKKTSDVKEPEFKEIDEDDGDLPF